jgi:hypothetical protein
VGNVGAVVGTSVGMLVGNVGVTVGTSVGMLVGNVGVVVGTSVGMLVGKAVSTSLVFSVGKFDGIWVVGFDDGKFVGLFSRV